MLRCKMGQSPGRDRFQCRSGAGSTPVKRLLQKNLGRPEGKLLREMPCVNHGAASDLISGNFPARNPAPFYPSIPRSTLFSTFNCDRPVTKRAQHDGNLGGLRIPNAVPILPRPDLRRSLAIFSPERPPDRSIPRRRYPYPRGAAPLAVAQHRERPGHLGVHPTASTLALPSLDGTHDIEVLLRRLLRHPSSIESPQIST
jgi:hypothetical protein